MGERVPGRANRMDKGSLRGRELGKRKEPNKGQCGWSPENKAEKGVGARSSTCRTSTWIGLLDCSGTAEQSTQATDGRAGHWPLRTFSFVLPFSGVTCPFWKWDPLDLRAIFACCSHTFGGCQNEKNWTCALSSEVHLEQPFYFSNLASAHLHSRWKLLS